MSASVHVKGGRPSPDARCAFCHDALAGDVDACPRCQTAFHRDCGAHLERCPTLGCGTDLRASARREDEAPLLSPLQELRLALLRERWVALVLLVLAPNAPAVLGRDVPVLVLAAVAVAWATWVLGQWVLLTREAGALLGGPAEVFALTLREERREEGSAVRGELRDPGTGRTLGVDLSPALASAPAWLRRLPPGANVRVRGAAGPGALVLEEPGTGRLYAVPGSRVRRAGL